MAERLDPKEVTSIEEIAVSNAWEIAALVKLLVQNGILTAKEVLDTTKELRKQAPETHGASSDQEPFPEPYLLADTENAILECIFEVFTATGLTSQQARTCLGKPWQLIEVGEKLATAKRMTH